MFTKNTELERRNTDPVLSTRKPLSWRKRFRKKKKNENDIWSKSSSPEDEVSIPEIRREEDRRKFIFETENIRTLVASKVNPLQRNWSIENVSRCGIYSGFEKRDEMEKRRHSTIIPSTHYEDIDISEENIELDTKDYTDTLSNVSDDTRVKSVDFITTSSHIDDSIYTKTFSTSDENEHDKEGDNVAIEKTNNVLENQDVTFNVAPAQRRKQGTSALPVIRGRNLSSVSNDKDELETSLSLLNISVTNKRNRAPSPSRFGKRLARRFVSLSQSNESLLLHAVTNQDYEMIEKLVCAEDNECNINYLYPPGVTILHQACVLGDFEIVKLLIEKGADVKIKTWSNLSPTKLAVTYGHFDIAQLLLLTGADVDDIKNGIQVGDLK